MPALTNQHFYHKLHSIFLAFLYWPLTDSLVFYVDVKDVALLHIAAILDPEVKNTRLQAWAHACNWNDILDIMRRLYPQREFVDNLYDVTKLSMTTDLTEPLTLLKKWAGQNGFRTLEQTVKDDVEAILKLEAEA